MALSQGKILITDSLFIYREHEDLLKNAGFELVRLDKPSASEDEIISHLDGVVGYILGGLERVTARVIEAATSLRAIAFTGSGYHEFIPGLDTATRRGVAVSAAIGANARAVAEYALTLTLALVRRLPELTTVGGSSFMTVKGFKETTVGVIGMGKIGTLYSELASKVGFRVIAAKNSKSDSDRNRLDLRALLPMSDIVSLHVSKPRGTGVLGSDEIALLRPGVGIINTSFSDAINMAAVEDRINDGSLYLAADGRVAMQKEPKVGHYLASNAQTAYNTSECNKNVSDRATKSILNLLATGDDADLVNPDYRRFRG